MSVSSTSHVVKPRLATVVPNKHTKYPPSTPITPQNINAHFDTACTDTAITFDSVPASKLLTTTASNLTLKTAKPNVSINALGKIPISIAGLEAPAHLFKPTDLANNLISVSDITNAPNNAECRFNATGLGIYEQPCSCGNQLAFFPKKVTDKLWSTTSMHTPKANQILTAIRSDSAYDFVMLYHAIFGSPTPSTFYRAVRNRWIDIKNLTAGKVFRNWPNSLATAQGHLMQTRQGLRSTQPKGYDREKFNKKPVDESSPMYFDTTENTKEEFHIRTFSRKDAAFADATGRYPVISIEGFEYLLIFVYKNYIHVEPLTDRSAASYVKAYTAGFTFFANRGHTIRDVVLDNETSAALEVLFREKNIKFQYVPPGNKRSNRAERAIQTWRHHMLATLGTVNMQCPNNLWSKFIEQMELCLAFLRPYEDNPKLSAYEGLHGKKYDHDAHPLSICGCPVLVLEPAAERPTWSTHGVQGFYLGPNQNGYRSWNFYIPSTKSVRNSDTAQFFPAPFKLPGASYEEEMLAAIDKLIAIVPTGDAATLQPAVDFLLAIKQRSNVGPTVFAPNQPDGTQALEIPPPLPVIPTPAPDTAAVPVEPVQIQRVPKEKKKASVSKQRVPPPEPPVAPPTPINRNPLERRRSATTKRVPIDVLRAPTEAERTTPTFKEFAKRIGQRFLDTDTDETFVIESVQMPLKPRGPGSQTHHFVYTDIRQGHLRLKQRQQEYTRCSELENATYVRWLTPKGAAYAILSNEPYDNRPLNQRADGLKFTVRRELQGPRGGYWQLGRREEHMRLFDSGTLEATHRRDIPAGETITYYNEQPKEKLKISASVKHVEYRVRGTYGGSNSNYSGPVSTNTAEYPVVKMLLNATLSDRIHKDPNTKFATADMTDFYLGTDLDQPGYMVIPADDIGDEIIDLYNLREFVALVNGKRLIYFKVLKCLYGHPASGRLSFEKLKGILEEGGFVEHPLVECLFIHKTRNISFALIVDDMGIKYANDDDLDYLINVIEPHWKLKVDKTGSKFVGMHLIWQYERPTPRVMVFNPTVVRDALARFAPGKTLRGRSTPSPYSQPVYGKHNQTGPFDDSSPAPPETVKFVQEVTGLFNHYSRVIDYTMAEAVTSIARTQAAPTEDTLKRVNHLLNYAASNPDNCIVYEASDMILTAQSDASFQSIPGSRSKAGGVFYFANKGDPPSKNNGLIGIYSRIISVVCAAASDAEYAALFQIAQLMYHYRTVAAALGYPQPPSPIYVDNDVARGIADRSVKIKRSKSIDKSFHYIRDRVELKDIVILRVGTDDNISDFFTKALPPQRHKYLASKINQSLSATLNS